MELVFKGGLKVVWTNSLSCRHTILPHWICHYFTRTLCVTWFLSNPTPFHHPQPKISNLGLEGLGISCLAGRDELKSELHFKLGWIQLVCNEEIDKKLPTSGSPPPKEESFSCNWLGKNPRVCLVRRTMEYVPQRQQMDTHTQKCKGAKRE